MRSVEEFYELKDHAGVPKRNTHDIGNFEVYFCWQLDEICIRLFSFLISLNVHKGYICSIHVYIVFMGFVLQYCEKYADLVGVPHLEEWRKELCMASIKKSEVDLETYREYSYDRELLQVPHHYLSPKPL